MDKRRVYTDEHVEFLKQNVKGRSTRELLNMFNANFGLNISLGSIQHKLYRSKLYNGFGNGFTLLSASGLADKYQFKPGHKAHNAMPIGAETVHSKCIYVKVSDEGTSFCDNWRRKHIIIWESVNGPVPEGHCIVFGDRNNRNFDIDNLILVSKSTNCALNKLRLRGPTAELTKVGIAVAELSMKVKDKRKKQHERVK